MNGISIAYPIQLDDFPTKEAYKRIDYKELFSKEEGQYLHQQLSIDIKKETIVKIGDQYGGHTIYLVPKDTLWMKISHYPENRKKYLENGNRNEWSLHVEFLGRNAPRDVFYDSLAYHYKTFFTDYFSFHLNSKQELDFFLNEVSSQYQKRILYLEEYSQKYHLDKLFIQRAKTEIKTCYINDLSFAFDPRTNVSLKDFPKKYINSIKNYSFDSENYFNTSLM